MQVLGIQGSPRKNGNSDHLLTSFLKECASLGAKTRMIRVENLEIQPCMEFTVCEKKGFCPIKDEMEEKGYSLLRQADLVVLASPVFFYNVTAQAKAFIDRCQMFWGRKYKLKLKDPDVYTRQGFLLSLAASGGKRLFEGVELTARYFFDAVSADYSGSLTYKKVEDAGDVIFRPELEAEIREAAAHLIQPVLERKKLTFFSLGTGRRSLMAAAFAKVKTKGRINIRAMGRQWKGEPDSDLVKVMEEKKLDLKYHKAGDLEGKKDRILQVSPGEKFVFIGTREERATFYGLLPGEDRTTRFLEVSMASDLESLREVRDELETMITGMAL